MNQHSSNNIRTIRSLPLDARLQEWGHLNPAMLAQANAKLRGTPRVTLTSTSQTLFQGTDPLVDFIDLAIPGTRQDYSVAKSFRAVMGILTDTGVWNDQATKRITRFISGRMSGLNGKPFEDPSSENHNERTFLTSIINLVVMFRDGQPQTNLHVLMSHKFKPKSVEDFEGVIRSECANVLDSMKKSGDNEIDLVHEFAGALSVVVISSVIGIPPDRNRAFVGYARNITKAIDLYGSREDFRIAAKTAIDWYNDMKGLFQDSSFSKQFRSIFQAHNLDGNDLSEEDIIANIIFLYVAGHETTQNFILSEIFEVLNDPKLKKQVMGNKDFPWKDFQSEVLRCHPVAQIVQRTAHDDIADFYGVSFSKGQRIRVGIAAALHDPQKFEDPYTFDLTRSAMNPAHHLAFGAGPHFCIGRHLALKEGEIALEMLLKRFPNIRFTSTPPEMDPESYNTSRYLSFRVTGIQ